MSRRFRSAFAAAVILTAVLAPYLGAADAAEQGLQAVHGRADRSAAPDCGCCGCWVPQYVRHREILYTYPTDPRYTLTSEPHYTLGRVYTFVHNW